MFLVCHGLGSRHDLPSLSGLSETVVERQTWCVRILSHPVGTLTQTKGEAHDKSPTRYVSALWR